jgi:hypothetical protein
LHGIFVLADEILKLESLLEFLEEKLHLPSRLLKFRDR